MIGPSRWLLFGGRRSRRQELRPWPRRRTHRGWRLVFWLATAAAVAALATGFWIPAKAALAQILLERAWQSAREGNDDARPWPWADTVPIARLTIPQLGVTFVVLSGASGRNLAFAPSHLDGSALPGENGLGVIAGHRDTHFDRLGELEPGAVLTLEDQDGQSFSYTVTGTEIVDSTKTEIRLDGDRPLLLLSTCYPFDALTAGGPLRYLVFAEMLPG